MLRKTILKKKHPPKNFDTFQSIFFFPVVAGGCENLHQTVVLHYFELSKEIWSNKVMCRG